MPKGPRGEKRPADGIGAAVKLMRIATGAQTEELEKRPGQERCGLRTSPALAAAIESRFWSMEDVVALIDAPSAKVGGKLLAG